MFSKGQSNKIKQLGVFIHPAGIARCSGRLDNASELTYTEKYPIILPKNDYVTQLLISEKHEALHHAWTSHTLSELRRRYWVIQGRSQVKKVLGQCTKCRRTRGKAYRLPDPPPLPDFRVQRQEPFATTGLDYLGPLYVKQPNKRDVTKVWICLYTCAVTRAIHLETVTDMTATQFLQCLRRFMAICGKPSLILCDNAKQFHTTERVFNKLWAEATENDEVQDVCSGQQISWKFTVELAPWMGGFYERMVALVKTALRQTLQSARITAEELQTVCYEVAAVLNTRPLTYCEDDASDIPLSPADLIQRRNSQFPALQGLAQGPADEDFVPAPATQKVLILQWRRTQQVLNALWNKWRTAYLQTLKDRAWRPGKRNTTSQEPKIGTVVLIKDDLPRGRWQVGKIVALHDSRDRSCRSAKLVLPNKKTLNRPIRLLYPIELSADTEAPTDDNTNRPPRRVQPPRRAKAPPQVEESESSDDSEGDAASVGLAQ